VRGARTGPGISCRSKAPVLNCSVPGIEEQAPQHFVADDVPGAPRAGTPGMPSSPQSSSERVGSRKARLGDPYCVVVVVEEVVVVACWVLEVEEVVVVACWVLEVVEVVEVVVVAGFLIDGTHSSRR
jgi:hypothetical protein